MTSATSQASAESALHALAMTPGVRGVILASRDGLPVLERWPHAQEVGTFVAMQATALAAAEIAVASGSARRTVSMVIQDGSTRHIVTGVTRDLFVILWAEKSLSVDECLDEIGELALRLG